MMEIEGFAFLEVLSPCPPTFGEYNGYPQALDMMKHFRENSIVDETADLSTIHVSARQDEKIVVGNFVNRRRPSYQELLAQLQQRSQT